MKGGLIGMATLPGLYELCGDGYEMFFMIVILFAYVLAKTKLPFRLSPSLSCLAI